MTEYLQNKTHASIHRDHHYARQPRFGPYIIGATIGKGSFGKVKAALHTTTGCSVALKVIGMKELEKCGNPEDTYMKANIKLQREVRALHLLSGHPHITRMYDAFRTRSGDTIFVLELVEGGELYDYLLKVGRLSEELARHFFQQIISAVATAHAFGVCHRDIKPENILMYVEAEDPDDELKYPEEYSYKRMGIKIGDFGLSSVTHDGKHFDTSCGTPNYAAPEIINGCLYDGKEVDVWSCGVVLFSMLTGALPFDDDRLVELFQKIRSSTFAFPCEDPKSEMQRKKEEEKLWEKRAKGKKQQNNIPFDDRCNNGPISEAARHLICRMLTTDPTDRATTEEIMSHPWMHGYSAIVPHEYSERNKEKRKYMNVPYMFNKGHSVFPSYLITILLSAQEERRDIPHVHHTYSNSSTRNRIETEADNGDRQDEYSVSRLQSTYTYRSVIDSDIVLSLSEKFKKCSRTINDILVKYDPTIVNSTSEFNTIGCSRHTLVDKKLIRSTTNLIPYAGDVLRSTEHNIFISYAILFNSKHNRERVHTVKRELMRRSKGELYCYDGTNKDFDQRSFSENMDDVHGENLLTDGGFESRQALLFNSRSSKAISHDVDVKGPLFKSCVNEIPDECGGLQEGSVVSLESNYLKYTSKTPLIGCRNSEQQMAHNVSFRNTKNDCLAQSYCGTVGRETDKLGSFDISPDSKLPIQNLSIVSRGTMVGDAASGRMMHDSLSRPSLTLINSNELGVQNSCSISYSAAQKGHRPRLLNPSFSYHSKSMSCISSDAAGMSLTTDRQDINGIGSSSFIQSNANSLASRTIDATGVLYDVTPVSVGIETPDGVSHDFFKEQHIFGWFELGLVGCPNRQQEENTQYYRCCSKMLNRFPFGVTRAPFCKHTPFSEDHLLKSPSLHLGRISRHGIPYSNLTVSTKITPIFNNGVHFRTSSTCRIKNAQDVQECVYRSLVRHGFIWKVIKPYQLVAVSSPSGTTNPAHCFQVKIFTCIYKLSMNKKKEDDTEQHFVVGIRLSDKVVGIFNGISIVHDLFETLFDMAYESTQR